MGPRTFAKFTRLLTSFPTPFLPLKKRRRLCPNYFCLTCAVLYYCSWISTLSSQGKGSSVGWPWTHRIHLCFANANSSHHLSINGIFVCSAQEHESSAGDVLSGNVAAIIGKTSLRACRKLYIFALTVGKQRERGFVSKQKQMFVASSNVRLRCCISASVYWREKLTGSGVLCLGNTCNQH